MYLRTPYLPIHYDSLYSVACAHLWPKRGKLQVRSDTNIPQHATVVYGVLRHLWEGTKYVLEELQCVVNYLGRVPFLGRPKPSVFCDHLPSCLHF